jgi:hypothetical protein
VNDVPNLAPAAAPALPAPAANFANPPDVVAGNAVFENPTAKALPAFGPAFVIAAVVALAESFAALVIATVVAFCALTAALLTPSANPLVEGTIETYPTPS